MSSLADKIASGEQIITGELPVVDSGGLDVVRRVHEPYAEWCDAMNATDNTAAHAHASNVSVAIAMLRLEIEPVMQVVCRDRNRLAIQGDIIGAALHGVENICCLTGDDVTAGDEPEARRVFDLDGPSLLGVASALKRGEYLSGRAIDPAPSLVLGAVENPGAPPLAYRAHRALKKVLAGATFLQLQIVYEDALLTEFMAECKRLGVTEKAAVLPSICLAGGARAFQFMNDDVPGISVPQPVIDRINNAADPKEEAFELACEQAAHALSLPGVRGLHLISFRKDDALSRLCERVGIKPRSERASVGHSTPVPV